VKNPRVGDWVWVKGQIKNTQFGATETEVEICEQRVYVRIFDCRPVEPPVIKQSLTTESNCPEIPNSSSEPMRAAFEADLNKRYGWNQGYFGRNENRYFDSQIEMSWQAFQAGAKYGNPSGRWEPTKDEIEYAMDRCGVPVEPLQVGDAVRFVWPGHKHHRAKGVVKSITKEDGEYLFESDCGQFGRWCPSDQIQRLDQPDPINPSHYKRGGIECIEAIKAALGNGFPDYLRGNVLKYLWRWPKKGGVEDLKKARWYLDRLIKEVGE